MRFIKRTLLLLLPALLLLTSCSETEDAVVYDTWAIENQAYLAKIAAEAGENATGDWKVFLAYGLDENRTWPADYYVYCKVKQSGSEPGYPSYNSVVSVNYSGRLINGTIFDETYTGELVPEKETPVELQLNACVQGFVTALQEMQRGDVWEIYIPSVLGYGSTVTGGIPAGSMLIFTVNLVDFVHYGETE